MVNIYKSGNGVLFKLTDNPYATRGKELSFPSNSLTLLIDNSDIVTIRSSADNEVMLAARIDEIMINDEAVTKEDIQEKWILVATSSQGGGGGTGAVNSVNGQTGDVVLTASSLNAYTKSQVDSLVKTKVDKETYNSDKATFALKSELPDMAQYVDKTSYKADKQTFALKSEIPSTENFVDKETYNSDKANFALKTEIPSLDGYATEEWVKEQGYLTEHQDISGLATKTELTQGLKNKVDKSTYDSEKQSFATKSEIADMATQTWVGEQGFLTSHQDISKLATKQELTEGLKGKQDKGDYALKSELPNLKLYATKSEVTEGLATKQDKGNYATKEELTSKQDVLESGTNIKTINGQTILGSGNIEIQGGGGGIADAPSDGNKYVRQNGNWVEETTVDTSNYATKSELANKVDTSTYTKDKATFALKSELTDLATKEELELKANTSDLSNYLTTANAETTYAKKSEIPSLDGYLQTSVADEKYATKTELDGKVDNADIADMLTKTEASNTYQPKGEYLTAVPSEYITETELNAKGYKKIEYLTQSQYDELPTKEEGVMYVITDAPEVVIPDTSTFATKDELSAKQDTLVSGTNIKTVNGNSLLGNGDIVIEGGGDVTKQYVDEQLALKADKTSVPTVQTNDSGNENNYIYSKLNDSTNIIDNGGGSPYNYDILNKNVLSFVHIWRNANTFNIRFNSWNNSGVSFGSSGDWMATNNKAGFISGTDKQKLDSINVETLATKDELSGKQDKLVSGESIKTINGESILGSGDIVIEGGAPGGTYIQNLNTVNANNIFGFYSIDNTGDGAKYPYKLTSRNGIKISKDSGNAAFIESDTEVLLTKTEASTTYKTISSEWFGTQSGYDLITEKDPNVTYYITEG